MDWLDRIYQINNSFGIRVHQNVYTFLRSAAPNSVFPPISIENGQIKSGMLYAYLSCKQQGKLNLEIVLQALQLKMLLLLKESSYEFN